MFKIGDIIIYGSQGACRVEDIGVPDISGIIQGKLYYTLSPIFVDGKIFIPVDTTIYMRPIITKEEAENIITQIPNIDTGIVENQNYKIMEDHYKKSIAFQTRLRGGGERMDTIYVSDEELKANILMDITIEE